MTTQPIGILYEHPEWFQPLFATLDRRGVPYTPILAYDHRFDPDERSAPYSLVVNRMSPSAYLRGHTSAIFHTQQYLTYLESIGVPLINGPSAYGMELSKARQLGVMARLGIPHPRSVVVNARDQIAPAAIEIGFPVIVKPNIGGSGALMQRFDDREELETALAAGALEGVFGLDFTAIVQAFHPAAGGGVVRVEVLDGQFLYAIRIASDPSQGFNLCPADICQVPEAPATDGSEFDLCPVDVPLKQSRQIEAVQPPAEVIQMVQRIFAEAGIDIGGVEYLESERDGRLYLYDVNSLSNFVTDAPTIVGFDPFERFVEYLQRRAGLGAGVAR